MVKTREDYILAGIRAFHEGKPAPAVSGTWQKAAFAEGWNSACSERFAMPPSRTVCARRARKLRQSGRGVAFVGRTSTGKARYAQG